MDHIAGVRCTVCGRVMPYREQMTCPHCGEKGILDILFDYDYIKKSFTKKSLADNHDNSMFRYAPLTPYGRGTFLASCALAGRRSILQIGWVRSLA